MARYLRRSMMTATATSTRAAKKEGSIAAIFTSLTDEEHNVLPDRFTDLKRGLWNEGLVESWREVLAELETATEEVASKGSEVSPAIASRIIIAKSHTECSPCVVQ